MKTSMHAVEISMPGGPEVLKLVERSVPIPGHGQILIKIEWAGVNRPDVAQRQGTYAPPPGASDLPGLECSGKVVAVGPGVTRWAKGDKVCALLPGGGYAEYAVCPAEHALPIPKGLSMRDAAALPETAFTVWSNVVTRGGLQAGERFLVHGGTSGIGTMAIQIGVALGARVWASAGSAQKCAAIEKLGATAINYRVEDFVEIMKQAGGANLVLDMVGGEYFGRNLRAMDDDGRMVIIAFLEGAKTSINLAQILMRRLTVTGSTLRPQSDLAKAGMARDLLEHLWPLVEAGRVRPLIDSEFDLAQAAAAHKHMESSQHIGKIMMRVAP